MRTQDVSPRDVKALVTRARGAYSRAIEQRCVYRQLSAALARPLEPQAALQPVTPYSRDDPSDSTTAAAFAKHSHSSKSTLKVWQMNWAPYADLSDVRTNDALLRAGQGKFLGEGMKRAVTIMVDVHDTEPCLLCGSGIAFERCCKPKVEQRELYAEEKIDGHHETYVYDPIDDATAALLVQMAKSQGSGERLNVWPHVRISPMEVQEIELTIPQSCVATVRARLDESELFLTTLPGEKWDYLGYFNLVTPGCGMSTFGDVTLSSSGVLRTEAFSAGRTKALVAEMRNLTCDMPVAKPTLKSTPSRHGQIEIDKLEQNSALLGEGLRLDVDVRVDKKSFARSKRCAYCHALETELPTDQKFQRCGGCGAVHYCGPSCQKQHWKTHKPQCKAAQAAAKATDVIDSVIEI